MGAQGSKQGGQVKKKKYKGHLIQTLDQHDGGINCMSLSEDGSVLATGNCDLKNTHNFLHKGLAWSATSITAHNFNY